METFDYVIVGSGSAGSVLANRLSEDATTSICVLEAGPSDWHPYIHLPAGFIKTFHMRSINWAYQQEPGPWTGGRRIYAPRGKTLGGSSSINGHIYNRGQRQDFDTWAQFGNRGWGYPDVLPYFKRLEKRIGEGDDAFRGRDGNLTVTTMDWRDPLCEAFMAGAMSLGIPRNPDYNGAIQEGVSYAQRTIRTACASAPRQPSCIRRGNGRMSTSAPTRMRPNIMLRRQARGRRPLHQGRQGRGADRSARRQGSDPGRRHLQLAAAAAIVGHRLAGPVALARHRGAPRAARRRRGIAGPLRAALGRPRQEHQDHQRAPAGLGLTWEAIKWVTTRRGLLSLSPTMVYCFWHSGETTESSDLQLTFTPASYKEGVQGQLEDQPGMTVASWQQRPESRGYVRARSADPSIRRSSRPITWPRSSTAAPWSLA